MIGMMSQPSIIGLMLNREGEKYMVQNLDLFTIRKIINVQKVILHWGFYNQITVIYMNITYC